ncbi:MAG: hypothetical protein JO272_00535 [Pseudonocardiales bacterium]|nr:hypothetical protein [Pseudonocardiales bacterium]
MQRITPAEGLQDLIGWMTGRGQILDFVRSLNGGGGWEQWAVIDFLRYQFPLRSQVQPLSYQRELRIPGLKRAFDIAYNLPSGADGPPTQQYPLILTQWKCLNDGNAASMGAQTDIGTLGEAMQRIPLGYSWLPVLVILCPQPVGFPGVQSQGVPGTPVMLHASSPATWQAYGISSGQ